MDIFGSESELATLFTAPFEPRKIIYSLTSDFFRDGNLACKIREKQVAVDCDDEELLHNPLPEFPCGERGCRSVFTTVRDFEIHYRSAHTIVCSECKKSFSSYNLLDLHIQERHDNYLDTAKDKNLLVFNCIVEGCDRMFPSLEFRNEHAVKDHNYPPNFKLNKLNVSKRTEKMDVTSCEDEPSPSVMKRKDRKSPPHNICFGRGAARAFVRRKKPKSTSTDITMKELADAL